MVESFARWLMGEIPAEEWRTFTNNASVRIVKLSGEKTSKSGSYKLTAPVSPYSDTQPPKRP
jgi:hypothetical protein